MELFWSFLRAVGWAGLPLFALAFLLVSWALHRGHVQGESFDDLRKNLEALAAASGKKKDAEADDAEPPVRKPDPALEKWFRFGGNFYGLVALYTWLRIELPDVGEFLGDVASALLSFDMGAVISLAIQLFIESLMNFIAAVTWPVHWLGKAQPAWLWLVVAYAGYWLGIRAAQRVTGLRWPGLMGDLETRDDDEDGGPPGPRPT